MGVLDGLRVLEVGGVLTGPYCSALLADLGAEVIKVEPPGGDVIRATGPQKNPGMSGMFLTLNRGKRSIALDLTKAAGRTVFLMLAKQSDVVVCNLRSETAEKLGISYADVAKHTSTTIYCTITGFGPQDPQHASPAYDDIIQAACGLVDLEYRHTGDARYVPLAVADLASSLMAVIAILGAVHKRTTSGSGERIDVPMLDTLASLVLTNHLAGSAFDPAIGPPVYDRVVAKGRKPFLTKDGVISVIPYSDENWIQFFAICGHPELASDSRFNSVQARSGNVESLYEVVAGALTQRTTDEWLEVLQAANIPCGPVRSTADLVTEDYLFALGLLQFVGHPSEGRTIAVGNPIHYGGDRVRRSSRPAPLLGEHSKEVLVELGYTEREISGFLDAGIVT